MTNKDLLKIFGVVVLAEAICHFPMKSLKMRKSEKYYQQLQEIKEKVDG